MEPQQVYHAAEEALAPSAATNTYYSDQYSLGRSSSMDLGRELTRQLTQALNLPRDTAALRAEDSRRGEEHSPLVELFSTRLLRNGLLSQAAALLLMGIFYVGFGGRGFFVFDSLVGPENVRVSDSYHLIVALLMLLYLAGTLQIAGFQIFIADSSNSPNACGCYVLRWTVGFRSGSKFLSGAVFLDMLATTLRLVQSVHAYFYLSVQWWAKFQRTQSDWSMYHIGATLHAFALLSYGIAFFFLESYHDQGTYEEYAYSLLALFGAAGAAELIMVYTNYGAFFSLLLLLALMVGVNWAFQFEPLLERSSPELHSRNVADNILPHAEMLRARAEKESSMRFSSNGGASSDVYSSSSPTVGTTGSPAYTAMPMPLEEIGEGRPDAGQMQRGVASVVGMYQLQSESPETGPPTTSIPLSALHLPGQTQMPTTYDYSQIHQQLRAEGAQPGVHRGQTPS